MARKTTFTDLPSDILYTIFPYLDASEFLSLTSANRFLHVYQDDPTFWHALTRKTFRIPPQPLLQGALWQSLYRKLLTQTRLYTWGDNKNGNLGHGVPLATAVSQEIRRFRHGRRQASNSAARAQPRDSGFPRQAVIDEELSVGIVADVQCGGWSTLLLNSIGAIYIFGIFDGIRNMSVRGRALRRLDFPREFAPTTKDRYEPSTAIQQFSTGRMSVLGLADDGKVWMWESENGFQVKPVHVNLIENRVERVSAGWDCNSMYVNGVGIVYWTSVQDSDIIDGARQENLTVSGTMLIETATIPGTGYRRRRGNRDKENTLEFRIGQVTNHVVLSGYIVFTTDLHKVFCYRTIFPLPVLDIPEPVELTTFDDGLRDQELKIRDLQGAFTRFAIFTESGSVLMGSEKMLNAYYENFNTFDDELQTPLPPPIIISSLQSGNIISLAFGDHHLHALYANGTITSYGQELQRCGALGLGDRTNSTLRGVRMRPGFGGGDLPVGEGRTVWFDHLMNTWLTDTASSAKNSDETIERRQMLHSGDPGAREAFANHFEREGAKWENDVVHEGEMGAYFVLKVAAAGWHSAALVLVDEDKAERAREKHIVRPTQPSPAPSIASTASSREYIESPFDQVAELLQAIVNWTRDVGRWFLGLTERDAGRKAAEREQPGTGGRDDGREAGEGEAIVYTWSRKPYPRLRLPNGEIMPGEVEVTE